MKPRLLLHIGSDKTGSSAIQSALRHSSESLQQAGVFVPDMPATQLVGHQVLFRQFIDGDAGPLQEALTLGRDAGCALLSWEGLHFLDEESLSRLAPLIAGFSLTVIFYVREQGELLQSALLQEVQANLRRVDFERESRHQELPSTRDFTATVERWNAALDIEHWELGLYDRRCLAEGDVVADLAQRLELPLQSPPGVVRQNPSLDLPSARLLSFIENLSLAPGRRMPQSKRAALIDILFMDQQRFGVSKPRYYLPPEEVARIREFYRASNQRLVSCYGLDATLLHYCELPWDVRSGQAQLEHALQRSLASLHSLADVPMLPRNGRRLKRLLPLLADGWFEPEEWGVWAGGECSRILFRLEYRMYELSWEALELRVAGRYFGGCTSTLLEVNGREWGTVDLRQHTIRIPREEFTLPLVLEICLHHEAPVSPAQLSGGRDKDQRKLTFGLEQLELRYI